jgi:hypothetical protein
MKASGSHPVEGGFEVQQLVFFHPVNTEYQMVQANNPRFQTPLP